jgi:alpha-glucosidase
MDSFEAVLYSQTKECYVQSLVEFRKVCQKFPRFFNYVEKIVLDTDGTKVVRAWTDDIMHFGNTTTNIAESSHEFLKKFLPDGNCDFMKVWEAIEKMLTCQFSTIRTAFGHSLNVEEHRFGEQKFLYALLFFKISRKAMDILFHEAKRSKECGMDPKKCGCVVRRSYGLPCACVIAKKIRNKLPIRLDEINVQWKKLVIDFGEGGDEEHDDYSCAAEFEAIKV